MIRAYAASAIGDIGENGETALDELVAALKDSDVNVRLKAAEALGKIGPSAKMAISAVVASLTDQSSIVTVHAAHALAQIGPESIPKLLPLLDDVSAERDKVERGINRPDPE